MHQPLPSFTIRGTVSSPQSLEGRESDACESSFPIGLQDSRPAGGGAKRRCPSEAAPLRICSPVRGGASLVMTSVAGKASKVDRMVLSPQEPLIAGGPAEELERRIQEIFKSGFEHVVIDLRGVPTADSAGIRALVRGHTSAQRLNRRFTLVSPNPRVTELLELSLLTRVLDVVDTLVEAKTKTVAWDRVWSGIAVAFVGVALVGVGMTWPDLGLRDAAAPGAIPGVTTAPSGALVLSNPLFELAKLIASAVIGMLVTIVHRQ